MLLAVTRLREKHDSELSVENDIGQDLRASSGTKSDDSKGGMLYLFAERKRNVKTKSEGRLRANT